MLVLQLLLAFLLQTAAPQTTPQRFVIVGLLDGKQLVIENPQFSGIIETRDSGEAVLRYRQKNFRGEMKVNTIQRIDLGYNRLQKPFPLAITMKDGTKINAESDNVAFIVIKGATDNGSVMIRHPEPLSPPVRLTTHSADRKNDLTIQYLEFPR